MQNPNGSYEQHRVLTQALMKDVWRWWGFVEQILVNTHTAKQLFDPKLDLESFTGEHEVLELLGNYYLKFAFVSRHLKTAAFVPRQQGKGVVVSATTASRG